jgi:hypothetical protein
LPLKLSFGLPGRMKESCTPVRYAHLSSTWSSNSGSLSNVIEVANHEPRPVKTEPRRSGQFVAQRTLGSAASRIRPSGNTLSVTT